MTNQTKFNILINGEYAGSIYADNAESAVRRWTRLHGRGYAGGNGVYPEIKATVSS